MTDILAPANSLQIYKGASKTIQLSIKDQAGEPFNLTGWTVIFTVKNRACSAAQVLIRKTTAVVTEVRIVSAVDGSVEIYLVPTDTAAMCAAQFVYDVWITKAPDAYPVVPPTILEVLSPVLTQ